MDLGTSWEFLNTSTPEDTNISYGMGYGDLQVLQPGVLSRLQGVPMYTSMFNSVDVVMVVMMVNPYAALNCGRVIIFNPQIKKSDKFIHNRTIVLPESD